MIFLDLGCDVFFSVETVREDVVGANHVNFTENLG
jgi:hypothetical protein